MVAGYERITDMNPRMFFTFMQGLTGLTIENLIDEQLEETEEGKEK